jgi:(R,R)-butanediol dehydrogenase/meso-butanediol dehydrogenase/diacetyl reductase
MLALRWHGRYALRLDDVEFDRELSPGEIEVSVAFCGICGSDLAEYSAGPIAIRDGVHRLTGRRPPITLGHEFSGTVTATGSDVHEVRVGDRVAADATWRCQRCDACLTGNYNWCADGASIGLGSDGAMAELVRFPAYCAVSLPRGVSDVAGALLEPLAVALHALDRGAVRPGDTVAVLGFGPIGAAVAEVGSTLGSRVTVGEVSRQRAEKAKTFGYETFSTTGEPREVARGVRKLTDGGVSVVIECSGAAAAIALAPELTRRGGRVVTVGLPKELVPMDVRRLLLYERSIVGALGYTYDLARVATLIDIGRLTPERLVTKTVALADAEETIATLASKPGDDLKVLIQPPHRQAAQDSAAQVGAS